MTRRGLVLGSSGVVGLAWMLGTLSALEEEGGWDARDADLTVGTSGGALLATLLRAGISVPELCEANLADLAEVLPEQSVEDIPLQVAARLQEVPARPKLPWPTIGSVRLAARGVLRPFSTPPLTTLAGFLPRGRGRLDDVEAFIRGFDAGPVRPDTLVVAMDHINGEREVFGSEGGPQCDHACAVIASMALPGWFAPVRIGSRRYIDGGLCSPSNADLAAGADEVVVLAPLAGVGLTRPRSPLALLDWGYRVTAARTVNREAEALRADGAEVHVFAPDAEALTVLGRNMMNGAVRTAALRIGHDHPTELIAA